MPLSSNKKTSISIFCENGKLQQQKRKDKKKGRPIERHSEHWE